MTKNAGAKKTSHESKIRTVQSGSVTVRIYEGRNRGKPYFTVIWYIGERRMRNAKMPVSDRALVLDGA